MIVLLWQEAPSPEQSKPLGRKGGKVVPLFLRVGLSGTDDVSVAVVLMMQNTSD